MIYRHHHPVAMEQRDKIPMDTICRKTVVNSSKKKSVNPVELSIALSHRMGQQVADIKANKQRLPMRSGWSVFS